MREIFVSWEWFKCHEYRTCQVMDYRNSYAQFLLEIDLFKISLESIFYASILLSLKLVAWTWNEIEFMLEILKKTTSESSSGWMLLFLLFHLYSSRINSWDEHAFLFLEYHVLIVASPKFNDWFVIPRWKKFSCIGVAHVWCKFLETVPVFSSHTR